MLWAPSMTAFMPDAHTLLMVQHTADCGRPASQGCLPRRRLQHRKLPRQQFMCHACSGKARLLCTDISMHQGSSAGDPLPLSPSQKELGHHLAHTRRHHVAHEDLLHAGRVQLCALYGPCASNACRWAVSICSQILTIAATAPWHGCPSPRMAWLPSCVADREAREPCRLPNGVRAAPTMTGQRSSCVPAHRRAAMFSNRGQFLWAQPGQLAVSLDLLNRIRHPCQALRAVKAVQ